MAKRSDIPEFGMLRGIKVVHSSTVVAGPIAAELMAEMGADVIWIESTKSFDTNRGKGGMGAECDRKNMRNISFDIPSPEGREILKGLLSDADVFIESSKGGTYAKWGLTDEVLWSWNPRLVIAHFSGYGQSGDPDYVNRGCYDPVCQAFSCYMYMQGFADREPLPGREIPTDYLAGLSGLANIIAAVRWAEKTGKGESFDIEIVEKHHNLKKDAPSGTALMLADSANSAFEDKKPYVCGREGMVGARGREIGLHAVRGGTIVGEHEVMFCGEDEIITLSHSARSKKVFAAGAIRAAKWIVGKPAGMYDMKNVLSGI